tara:strand:- start:756 stop:1781 length:1026 start_codon:yes stop_codon:yes gene_type:complete
VDIKVLTNKISFRKEKTLEIKSLFNSKSFEDAEQMGLDLIQEFPNDFQTHMIVSKIYFEQDKSYEAQLYLHNASTLEKSIKEQTRQSIEFAMQSDWINAIESNQIIIESFPWELEAYNRLGKAFLERGNKKESLIAFKCALVISPTSKIAQKNIERLQKTSKNKVTIGSQPNNLGQAFIQETGKTCVTKLVNIPVGFDLTALISGHQVNLSQNERGISITDQNNSRLGNLEPKLGMRLSRLISGGNEYQANITHVGENNINLIIRETFKHPSQSTKSSFPAKIDMMNDISTQMIPYEINDGGKLMDLKDWSDDDTESGDDNMFTPRIPQLIADKSPFDDDF